MRPQVQVDVTAVKHFENDHEYFFQSNMKNFVFRCTELDKDTRVRAEGPAGQTFERLEKGNVPSKLKPAINKQGPVENEACVMPWNKSFRLAQMLCFLHSNC